MCGVKYGGCGCGAAGRGRGRGRGFVGAAVGVRGKGLGVALGKVQRVGEGGGRVGAGLQRSCRRRRRKGVEGVHMQWVLRTHGI